MFKKQSLKLFAALLALVLAFPFFMFSASAETITVKLDGIDIVRGSGHLVVYTTEKGATTGTNTWGYEVIVIDNVATSYSAGNSAIPENGFVVSGHNEDENGKRMGDWIKENIEIGDYVYYTEAGNLTVSDEPIKETKYYSVSTSFHGFNTTRNTDTIIIYNKLGTRTGTNDWGYEVVCTAGVVTSLGGNNSLIPSEKGSFVVSGHGASVDWLQENVRLGMSVVYSETEKTVTFTYDETAALSGVETLLKDLRADYDTALKNYVYFDYNAAKTELDEFESAIKAVKNEYNRTKDGEKLATECTKLEGVAEAIALMISESRTVEYRGIWIRPTQTSAKEVDDYVQTLYENGINTLCIETLYDCTMIMPMPEGSLFSTNPKFKHFDMLQSYIDSCHKRGMELHIWLPIFYVGDGYSANAKYSLGTKKPEWLSRSSNGLTYQDGEGFMMIDPANEEACNYLLHTYKYILENYDIDGFQLDYIRYYSRTTDCDFGYNETALDAFEAEYGVRPQYNTKAAYWKDWVDFRCNYVTTFVSRIRKLIDETAPDVLLGADVVPEPAEARDTNYQDYYVWLDNGWLDIVHPMSYGYGYDDAIKAQTERAGDKSFIAVGLGIFMSELKPSDMQAQASYNTSVYTDGSVYFESSAFLKKDTGAYLKNGVYRNDAVTPTFDIVDAAKKQIEYAKNRINNIIKPIDKLSDSDVSALADAFDALAATFGDESFDTEKYAAVVAAIDASKASSNAKKVLLADLAISVKAYTVINKELDLSDVPDLGDAPVIEESKPESQPESQPDESEESEPLSEDEEPQKKKDYKLLIVIGCGVIIVAAAVVAIIVLKGNKK